MNDSERASDQAFLGGMTKDFAGQDIPINKYLDTAYKALYRDLINEMPNGGQIGAMVGLSEQSFNRLKGDFDKVSSETTDRREKLESLTKIINATDQEKQDQAFTGGDGLTFTETDSLFGVKERIATANTKEEVLKGIRQLEVNQKQAAGSGGTVTSAVSPTGGFYVEGTATGKREGLNRSELVVYPKNSAYGLSTDQFNKFSIREQENLISESNKLSNYNANIIAEYTTPLINQRIAQEKRADPTGDISTQDRKDNIKTVQEFYAGVKGTKGHKELVDRLSANPEKLQEYLNDPYEFALNNDSKTIFGEPVSATDDKTLRDSLSKQSLTYFPKIKKALADNKPIAEIKTLIEEAIAVNDQNQANLEELSKIPSMANGNLGQASPVAKYGAMLRIYGTMDPNTQMRNTFMSSDNVTNFLTYGTFIAPKEVKAPPVDTSGINVLSSTLNNALGNLDFTKIDDPKLSTTEKNNLLNEGVANLGTANSIILQTLQGVQNETTDKRIIRNPGFIANVQRYKEGQAKIIQMKIKQLADKSWWRDLIEIATFGIADYNETPQAFMETMSRLRDDPNAKKFIILDPGGGSSVASISYEDIQDPNLFKAFQEQAAVSAMLQKNNL